MRLFFLILSLTILSSCGKKSNEINSNKVDNGSKGVNSYNGLSSYNDLSTFVSEKALVIPHHINGSVFRSKLLNKIVEAKFPSPEANLNHIIQIHDELLNKELPEDELKDYEIKEKILTKVIVSFSDREEVYFVQEKIQVKDLISTLNLYWEDNRKLMIVSSPFSETYYGLTFHIISLNHEDLMLNDQLYYNVESTINNFQEKINFENYKKILLKVGYDFQVQALAPVVYTAPSIRCTKFSIEDGTCGPGCSLTTDLPSSTFENMSPKKLQDLGLVIKYGDKMINVDQLPMINLKEGYFEINLYSLDRSDNELSFELLKLSPPVYSGTSAQYNYSNHCSASDKGKVNSYSLATQINFNLKMNIFGRGEELKEIKL